MGGPQPAGRDQLPAPIRTDVDELGDEVAVASLAQRDEQRRRGRAGYLELVLQRRAGVREGAPVVGALVERIAGAHAERVPQAGAQADTLVGVMGVVPGVAGGVAQGALAQVVRPLDGPRDRPGRLASPPARPLHVDRHGRIGARVRLTQPPIPPAPELPEPVDRRTGDASGET